MFEGINNLRLFHCGPANAAEGFQEFLDWPDISADQPILLLFPGAAFPREQKAITGLAKSEHEFLIDHCGEGLHFAFLNPTMELRRLNFWRVAAQELYSPETHIILIAAEDLSCSLELNQIANLNPHDCHHPLWENFGTSFIGQYNIVNYPDRLQILSCSAGTAQMHHFGATFSRIAEAAELESAEIARRKNQISAIALCPIMIPWHHQIGNPGNSNQIEHHYYFCAPPFNTQIYADPVDFHAQWHRHEWLSQLPEQPLKPSEKPLPNYPAINWCECADAQHHNPKSFIHTVKSSVDTPRHRGRNDNHSHNKP